MSKSLLSFRVVLIGIWLVLTIKVWDSNIVQDSAAPYRKID